MGDIAERRRESLVGSGVASGIAVGRAHLLAPSELDVRQYTIERRDVLHEIGRLTSAFNVVREELDELKRASLPTRRAKCVRFWTCIA